MQRSVSISTGLQLTNEFDLKRLHLNLNHYYQAMLFGNAKARAELDLKQESYKKSEALWIHQEKLRCLSKYDCEREVKNSRCVEEALRAHAVVNHPIFDYLCYEADLNQLKQFISSEAILNLEFFDYLALAVIGASDQTKAELVRNLWDEAGQGEVEKFHTSLFRKLMADLGLNYQREAFLRGLSWEGVAGINLFSYCALYSYNKMLYYGLLAATELLDPPHYQKLILGMRRLFKGKSINHTYYLEHEIIDVEHAEGWLRKIILPELSRDPQKTQDFWLGFYLRLDSAKIYYDKLLQLFTQGQAA
jgi:hypothetical protein